MNIGSMGIVSSAAATPAAQSRSSDVERAQRDAAVQQRHLQSEAKAEAAAGIGRTDGDEHQAAERDADGRRLWEEPLGKKAKSAGDDHPDQAAPARDTTGQSGNQLDLMG